MLFSHSIARTFAGPTAIPFCGCTTWQWGASTIPRRSTEAQVHGRYVGRAEESPWHNPLPCCNRAPVLMLWAAVVAQRLGFDEDEALTLGKALAGLNAQAKGRRLGIFKPHEV